MAVIMRTVHDQNLINELKLKEDNIKHPVSYVDSINENSYPTEMHNICIRFIRETMKKKKSDKLIFTRDEHCVKEEKDISNKSDGYYYIKKEIIQSKENIMENDSIKESTFTFVVYEKNTYKGYFSTYPVVKKLFTLTSFLIIKIVPKVCSIKTTTTFDDFDAELKHKVTEYRNRTSDAPTNTVNVTNNANDSEMISVNHLVHNITKKLN